MKKVRLASLSLALSPPLSEIEIKGKHGLNILDRKLLQSLNHALERVRKEEGIKVALLFSGSEKGFAAGADMHELKELDTKEAVLFSKMGQDLFWTMEETPVFFIGVIDGYCIGGGFDLALACDLLICSEGASFQHPGASRGFITGFGGNFRLAESLGREKSAQVLISGKQISAEEMVEYGLPLLLHHKSSNIHTRDRVDQKSGALSHARQVAKRLSMLHYHQIQLIKKIIKLPASIPFRNKAFIESSLSLLYSFKS